MAELLTFAFRGISIYCLLAATPLEASVSDISWEVGDTQHQNSIKPSLGFERVSLKKENHTGSPVSEILHTHKHKKSATFV